MLSWKITSTCSFLYLCCCIFWSIISLNLLLIAVICCQRALHQPMYVFICNLAANGLYGSTGFLPSTLILLLSETYEISLPWCLIQIYWIHTYAAVEFHILAVMGYDRYVAICYPLHYHSIMSIPKMCKLIALAWLYPFSLFLMYFGFTLRLRFCGRFIHFKLFCVNFELVKNACSTTSYHSIVGLVLIAFLMIDPTGPHDYILICTHFQGLSEILKRISGQSTENVHPSFTFSNKLLYWRVIWNSSK